MIKIPSYIDFLVKLVSFLGIDFNDEKNSTDKSRIKELKNFNEQVEKYTDYYLPKIVDILGGSNKDNKQAISYFLTVIEYLMRYLNAKNYYTIASNKRAMWGLFVFYYIPQFACMLSILKNECSIPEYLINNDFMLPVLESNKIISPTERLKKYLKSQVEEIDFLDDYLVELDKNTTPRYQTKLRIIKKINENNISNIKEIESILNCAIVANNIYQEVSKFFNKCNDNYAFILVEYFRKCFAVANRLYVNIENTSDFEEFILFHNNLLHYELTYIDQHFIEENKIGMEECREKLFDIFNTFLYETTTSETEALDNIDTNKISCSIFKYLYETEYFDIEHSKIISLLNQLKHIFSNSEKEIKKDLITSIFNHVKIHKYFENYEHEILYYEGLDYLAKNDFSQAIEKLKAVREKCKKVTAGETNVCASEFLIILRLLTDNKISYSHLNPEIKSIIDSQPEELIMIAFPNPDEAQRHNAIYLEKVLKIIKKFNINGYAHYNGFECVKYNPLKKMDEWVADFFKLYDDKEYSSENEEQRVERTVRTLIKGRNAKYPFNKTIVTLLQYTVLEAIQNCPYIVSIYYDSRLSSENMDRFFGSPPDFIDLLAKTIENLIPNSAQPITTSP
jgi:hypothetical protein